MKTIYYTYIDDFECDAFFEINERMSGTRLSLIHFWHCNDASYRDEYMGTLFEHCGIEVKTLPEEWHDNAYHLLEDRIM